MIKDYLLTRKENNKIPKIRLVINSFGGNSDEFNKSNELLSFLNFKKIKVSEILDINQEMVLEVEKSKLN
jgi:hypothetical protein